MSPMKKSSYKKIRKDDKLVRAKEDLDEEKEGVSGNRAAFKMV